MILYTYLLHSDLGDPMEQVARLTCHNYEFKNLNPYEVMQMDIDASDDDIKYRYRKLSAKVHPDKLVGVENAREAFEQVWPKPNYLIEMPQVVHLST